MATFTEDDYIPEPNSGCWIWLGALTHDGYGRKGTKSAHRFVYEHLAEPVPNEMVLDHKCRLRCCVNPDHLEVVTDHENWRRGESFSARNARKTHCPNGHPYTPQNTYQLSVAVPGSENHRICRTCNAAAQQRRKARLRSKAE